MRILFMLALAIGLSACERSTGNFGAQVDPQGAISVDDLWKNMQGAEPWETKVKGTIQSVCQSKGCWYTLNTTEGEEITIVTRDHAFSIPKGSSGKTAIAQGQARWEVTTVDELKEAALEEGKKPEEIDQIVNEERYLVFDADGILIQ